MQNIYITWNVQNIQSMHNMHNMHNLQNMHQLQRPSRRCGRYAQEAAHTWAALRRPAACCGTGGKQGQSHCTRCTGESSVSSSCDHDAQDIAHTCARLAVIATCQRLYTHGSPSADQLPVADGWAVTAHELHGDVLCSLRPRRPGGGAHLGSLVRASCLQWQAGAVVSRERHGCVLILG